MSPRRIIKKWWHYLKYSPADSRFYHNYPLNIVAIGGGTGLSTLLRGLKEYSSHITAVVAVTDDGASSGMIRKAYKTLPPGDIRQCIAALSPDEELLTKLLNYRFEKGAGLKGHALGNLLTVALSEMEGGFDRAVIKLSQLLNTVGDVLPVTLNRVHLRATMASGAVVEGETKISSAGHEDPIKKVDLDGRAAVYPPVLEAINKADLIIIGPGSLFTSVIPPLLLSSVRSALKDAPAMKIYVCNCSTERGETENYSVADHLSALESVIGKGTLDVCLVNSKHVDLPATPEGVLGSITQLLSNEEKINGVEIVSLDLLNEVNPLYHDSHKLATAVMKTYNKNVDSKR